MQKALIRTKHVPAASIGYLLLAINAHASEHLKDLLARQILWVNFSQLVSIAIIAVAILKYGLGLKIYFAVLF